MQIVIESSMNNFVVVHTCDPSTQRQEYFYESGNSWSYIDSGQLMKPCLSLRKKKESLKGLYTAIDSFSEESQF